MLRWLKTVVVSDEEKAPGEASGGDQEDDHCVKRAVKLLRWHRNRGVQMVPG